MAGLTLDSQLIYLSLVIHTKRDTRNDVSTYRPGRPHVKQDVNTKTQALLE